MVSAEAHDPALAAASDAAEIDALVAGGTFGARLGATPEFAALLAASAALTADSVAQDAIAACREKQQDFRVEAAMNLLTEEQAVELDRLMNAMHAVPSVVSYVDALSAFTALCQDTSAVVSGLIGIDFAANSRSGGCCGG